jgi:hypothetical protein
METPPPSFPSFALAVASALVVAMIGLCGCAVGTAYVSAPDRLPSQPLPPLTHPIRFDVCGTNLARPQRADEGKRVREALSRAGVPAELTPAAGSPVDFTVTVDGDFDFGWSATLSFLTWSVVPGYFVARRTLEVDLAWRDAAQVEKTEHLRYQARTIVFIWLPLIVVPDFELVGDYGWSSPRFDDGGFKQIVARLGDDIRARLGGDAADPAQDPMVGVICPDRLRLPSRV